MAARYEVLLTDAAEEDIESIHAYIAEADSLQQADRVLDRLSQVFSSLEQLPERGSFPKELLALGIKRYRQVFFKPYRLIYEVADRRVFIMLVVDGRRDMEAVLARRLLGG